MSFSLERKGSLSFRSAQRWYSSDDMYDSAGCTNCFVKRRFLTSLDVFKVLDDGLDVLYLLLHLGQETLEDLLQHFYLVVIEFLDGRRRAGLSQAVGGGGLAPSSSSSCRFSTVLVFGGRHDCLSLDRLDCRRGSFLESTSRGGLLDYSSFGRSCCRCSGFGGSCCRCCGFGSSLGSISSSSCCNSFSYSCSITTVSGDSRSNLSFL